MTGRRSMISYTSAKSRYKFKTPKRRKRSYLSPGRSMYHSLFELKFLDCGFNGVPIESTNDGIGVVLAPSSGCINSISVPTQGDGEQERDGRKYMLRAAYFSGIVEMPILTERPSPVDYPPYFFALVLDMQTNGGVLNSGLVYVNPTTVTDGMFPKPLRNLQHVKRFKILASKVIRSPRVYQVNDGATTGSLQHMVYPTVELSWKGAIPCISDAVDANVASASDNSLHIIALSASVGGAVAPNFIGKSRVRFTG